MSGTHSVVMGDRGRLVVPAAARRRMRLEAGDRLLLVETSDGLLLATREQLLRKVREELAGLPLVDELLAERRAAAALEDAE